MTVTKKIGKSRWDVPLLIIGGIAIGVAISWSVLISLERLATDSVPKPPKNWADPYNQGAVIRTQPITYDDNSKIYPPTTTSSVSLNDPSAPSVNWIKPKELSRTGIYNVFRKITTDQDKFKKIVSITSTIKEPPAELLDETGTFYGIYKMWKQGTVTSGSLKDASVYLIEMLGWNTGPGLDMYQVVVSADEKQLFAVYGPYTQEAYSPVSPEFYSLSIATLPSQLEIIRLSGIQARPELHYRGHTLQLTNPIIRGEYVFDTAFNHDFDPIPVAVTDEGVPLYRNKTFMDAGCLAAILDTGLVVHYTMDIPSQKTNTPLTGTELDIKWNNGYQNDTKFVGKVFGGCGGGYCANIASSTLVGDESNLVAVGSINGLGDALYAPKDPIKHPLVQQAYDQWYNPSGKKPTIQEMVDQMKVPIFFWKDPMGRWVEYESDALIPQAECGKPVIYLYPEKTTDVHVSLPKFINVTVSDPAYPSGGWNVTASPNGDLLSHADGKTYGSLYWEGTGVGYQEPKTGFVVKDGEVSTFFASVLPKYGLNQKEANEFVDFWIPKLKGSPYYRISFLTDDWSSAAPLNVSPRPQTSIRIFMDWKLLSAPISIKEPKIVTPERNGFTLVEWGGMLYK